MLSIYLAIIPVTLLHFIFRSMIRYYDILVSFHSLEGCYIYRTIAFTNEASQKESTELLESVNVMKPFWQENLNEKDFCAYSHKALLLALCISRSILPEFRFSNLVGSIVHLEITLSSWVCSYMKGVEQQEIVHVTSSSHTSKWSMYIAVVTKKTMTRMLSCILIPWQRYQSLLHIFLAI